MADNDDLTDLMAGAVDADGTPAARPARPTERHGTPTNGSARVAEDDRAPAAAPAAEAGGAPADGSARAPQIDGSPANGPAAEAAGSLAESARAVQVDVPPANGPAAAAAGALAGGSAGAAQVDRPTTDGPVEAAEVAGVSGDGLAGVAEAGGAPADQSVRAAVGDGPATDSRVRAADAEGQTTDLISRAYAYDDLTDLIARAAEANEALLNGDAGRYVELLPHTDDYTLMAPFGGEPIRGHDDSPEARAASARFFQGGAATFDVVESYTSGDLAVLVVVERQTVRVGDLPEQDWSLRVTLVFRRQDGRWCLAHRHADVLLSGITIERAAAIARGEG